jgi:hypothetical protein
MDTPIDSVIVINSVINYLNSPTDILAPAVVINCVTNCSGPSLSPSVIPTEDLVDPVSDTVVDSTSVNTSTVMQDPSQQDHSKPTSVLNVIETLIPSIDNSISNPVLPVDELKNGSTHRVAIRLSLILTIPKSEESIRNLKLLCRKIGVGNLYFYTVQDKNSLTHDEVKSLLSEYGVKYFKYIRTNGCDSEIMDQEKITHIVDDRPRWLSGMLTFDGYIRKCYCVMSNPNLKYLNADHIKISSHWLEMVRLLTEEFQQPLQKYDNTECWKCVVSLVKVSVLKIISIILLMK